MKDPLQMLANLDLSKLHFFSFGIVVDCNNCKSEAKIFPVEKIWDKKPPVPEDLKKTKKYEPKVKFYKIKTDDPNSRKEEYDDYEIELEIEDTAYIVATWMNLSQSNRTTPPCLGIGEKVMLFRFSNNDEYYWDTISTNINLRKNEIVHWTFMKDTGTYGVTVSPKDGYITVSTNGKDDGDKFNYDIDFNPGEGYYILIQDGDDYNNITLSSKDNAYFVEVKELYKLKTEGQVEIHMKNGFMVSNGGDELIQILLDLTQLMSSELHTGNLGRPTPLKPAWAQGYRQINQRLQKFKVKKPSSIQNPAHS